MGAIKQRVIELAKRAQDLLNNGVQYNELDYYMDEWCTDDEYELYHSYKDAIVELLDKNDIQEKLNVSSISDNEYIMKSLNEERYSRSESHPLDDLKVNFRSWETNVCAEEDADHLTRILQTRHPEFNIEYLRQLAYNWCGIEFEDLDETFDF